MGFANCDIKPENTRIRVLGSELVQCNRVVDYNHLQLVLCDWGLACTHQKSCKGWYGIGTRFFRVYNFFGRKVTDRWDLGLVDRFAAMQSMLVLCLYESVGFRKDAVAHLHEIIGSSDPKFKKWKRDFGTRFLSQHSRAGECHNAMGWLSFWCTHSANACGDFHQDICTPFQTLCQGPDWKDTLKKFDMMFKLFD